MSVQVNSGVPAGRDRPGREAVTPGPAPLPAVGRMEALHQSRQLFSVSLDPAGRIVSWNRGAENLLGWTEAEIRGRPFTLFLPADDADVWDTARRVFGGETVERRRMPHRRRDGGTLFLDLTLWPRYGATGEPAGIRALGCRSRASREALETELERAHARLSAARLTPHFLLNALNSVGVLVRTGDPGTATAAISTLGDLLRHVLETGRCQEVPLRREVEFVGRYLRMEALRFRSAPRLEVDLDGDAGRATVPAMILQPLVENSLRHGGPGTGRTLRIGIRARRREDQLEVEVLDDGRGLPPGWDPTVDVGTGLSAVRDRLAGRIGGDAVLEVSRRAGPGVRVTIRLPYREGPAPVR